MNLYKHQLDGVEFMLRNDGGLMWFAMGLGKTAMTLEAYKHWHQRGLKMLVVCPLSLIETAWREDIARFAPEFTMCNLHDKRRSDADIYVVNYESFVSNKRYEEIQALTGQGGWVCVLDESSRISNFKAKTTRNILSLRDRFTIRVALTGTPCSQSEFQLHPQICFVRDGILPGSPWAFKNIYFHLQRGKQTLPLAGQSRDVFGQLFSKGWKIAITDTKRKSLMTRISPIVLQRSWEDCEFELPPFTDEVRQIEMDDEQAKAYRDMKNHMVAEIKGSAVVAQMALTKLMKLRQITSGFAIGIDETTQRLPSNPKLDELSDVLGDIGNEQAVIFVNFRAEVQDLVQMLGDKAVIADGSVLDKTPSIESFKSGEKQYLIANIASLSHGVTLTNCRYLIYYSQTYSLEKTEQSRARIRRISQTRPQVYIHLLCKDTVDEVIYDVLQKKGEAVDIVSAMLR